MNENRNSVKSQGLRRCRLDARVKSVGNNFEIHVKQAIKRIKELIFP